MINDKNGQPFKPEPLDRTVALLSASGDTIVARQSATLSFELAHSTLEHSMYLIDKFPITEKIILGMDFLVKHEARIDIAASSIELNSRQSPTQNTEADNLQCYSLVSDSEIRLEPRSTVGIYLTPVSEMHHNGRDGHVTPDNTLPDACIIWQGIHSQQEGRIRVWVTNLSENTVTIPPRKAVATWQPDFEGEIHLADKLVSKAKGLEVDTKPHVLSLTTSENGQDWEWCNEHTYYPDLSNTPPGIPEPPPQASIEELRLAWEQAKQSLQVASNTSLDDCEETRKLLQHMERINIRIKRYADEDDTAQAELPSDLKLDEGYDHLSISEAKQLRELLLSEAAFFMKGKYPKVIRTDLPVHIDVGTATPRVSGYRRLNPEEQAVVNEYVDKLISADVVEPGNGPWSSPILLVPKKDGGLRAVAQSERLCYGR
jgi:hypothetical protein